MNGIQKASPVLWEVKTNGDPGSVRVLRGLTGAKPSPGPRPGALRGEKTTQPDLRVCGFSEKIPLGFTCCLMFFCSTEGASVAPLNSLYGKQEC